MSTTTAKTIFVSYAHEDDFFRQELEKHLQALYRQQLIEVWHDRRINAGTDLTQQMSEFLNTADIILLLVSPDFLASDYRYSVEMVRAMERHKAWEAQVIPIILRPVSWEGTPFAALQLLPADGKPVTAWPSTDTAFLNVAENIRRVVRELQEIDQALSHMAAERYDQALAAYERVLQSDRRSAAAYAGKGDVLLALGHLSKALDAYGQALLLDPTHPASESGRGTALLGLKRYEEALAAFHRAISLDPTLAPALSGKGDALFQLERYGEALEAYDKALRLNSDNTHLYVSRGYVLEQLAQQSFEKAKQLGHSGEIHMEQGDRSHMRTPPSFPMHIENLVLAQTILLPDPDPASLHLYSSNHQNLDLTAIAMSPDGNFFAGAPGKKDLMTPFDAILWDVATGKIIKKVGKFTGIVDRLLFSADGQTLLSRTRVFERQGKEIRPAGYEDREWSMKTGEVTRKLPRNLGTQEQFPHLEAMEKYPSHPGIPLASSLDGKKIVGVIFKKESSYADQMLIVWDAPTGKILHMMSDMPITITGMAISPDTQLLASGYDTGVIKLWNLSTAQLLYAFVGHESLEREYSSIGVRRPANSLLFSADGRQIVSIAGGEIKIWEIERLP